jgi:sec-independent protein translocase protein TatB
VFGLGATEIVVILVIALLVLGPKRLPDAARALGRGLGEFRRASTELRNAITAPLDAPEPELRSRAALTPAQSLPAAAVPSPAVPSPAVQVTPAAPAAAPASAVQPAQSSAVDDD